MSEILSNPPYISPKRSACDRCRSHKLRCPPRGSMTDICSRCARLGLRCVSTSYRTSEYQCEYNSEGHPARPDVAPVVAPLQPSDFDAGTLPTIPPSNGPLTVPVSLSPMAPPKLKPEAGCPSQQVDCIPISEWLLQGFGTHSDLLIPLASAQSGLLSGGNPLSMQDQLQHAAFDSRWNEIDSSLQCDIIDPESSVTFDVSLANIYPAVGTWAMYENQTSLNTDGPFGGAVTSIDTADNTFSLLGGSKPHATDFTTARLDRVSHA